MADTIRAVDYFYAMVGDKPGEGRRLLEHLSEKGVNLLAFTAFPTGNGKTQLDFFAEDAGILKDAAADAGLDLVGPKKGFLIQGQDRVGALHQHHLTLANAGINVVACIEKPDRLTREAWIAHWFGHHKRVAIETQCTFAYVRNLVVHPLTQGAPPWAGIVEEGFPTAAVTDPMLWYCGDGSEERMQQNMARMMESVQAFLDIDRVESNPMSEYRIKELA